MPQIHRGLAFLLHTSAVSAMAWGYFVGLSGTGLDEWVKSQIGGHMQFLTIQGLMLTCITMSLAGLHDLLPDLPLVKTLKRGLSLVALPLEFTVSIIYWSLILTAPDLIVPVANSEGEPFSAAPIPFRLDLSVDLALHAVPALTLLLDFLLFDHKFSRIETTYVAPALAAIMAVWYGSWVEYCASHNNGHFPYPFLTFSSFPVRLAIYASATCLALACLWIINPLHSSGSPSVNTD
ncbi:FAR-17a/AIG1-like protein [Vararia minispora EC-137]|uniref:FAR-17a/AIG1-like protein n=1 Tax=Vararia minispora EC-137 TaxID=1314806 RepID=A0ACB8QUX3_9AGAM|nr:FAR-17a/AIG1-like protein [Vararia minispora EC-137]